MAAAAVVCVCGWVVRCRSSVAGAVVVVDDDGVVVVVVMLVDGGVLMFVAEAAVVLPGAAAEAAPTVCEFDAGGVDVAGVVGVEALDASVLFGAASAAAEDAGVLDTGPCWLA